MGISRYFGDVLSVPNLFRNGGLDFQDDVSPLPPFYSITGAMKNAPIIDNGWSLVFNETPKVPGGPANYIKMNLPKADPVTIVQDFSNANATFDHAVPVTSGTSEIQPYDYMALESNILYNGKFSLSFAIRVPQGEVSLGLSYQLVSIDEVNSQYVEIDAVFSGTEWKRYTGILDVGEHKIVVVGLQVQRRGSAQAVEVHVGNIMLARGEYDDLPYTGDPSAAVFPRGAIVMAMGLVCPPGFVPIEDDGTYPREGMPGETGGARKHEHDLEQTMHPESAWPKRSLLDGDDARGGVIHNMQAWDESKGDPALVHTHPIIDDSGEDNTEPNSRNYIFCRRT